jgi:hypothetical protein
LKLNEGGALFMLPSPPNLHFSTSRHRWDDGRFSDVVVARFPSQNFVFTEIDQRDRTVKLSEVACLQAVKAQMWGMSDPRVVAFARLAQDRAASNAFPGVDLSTETGERLFSANSLLTYTLRTLLARGWLYYDGNGWVPAVPDNEPSWRDRARAVLDRLTRDDWLYPGGALGRRLSTPTAFEGFDVRRDLAPVDRLGFVREFVWRERPRLAFNAAFFLLEHDDFFSHHSALGEAYNLYVRDGAILRPPLYRRAAVYQTNDPSAGSEPARWRTGHFSLADLTMALPDGTKLVPEGSGVPGHPFALNPDRSAEVAVYTRTCGLASRGHPLQRTPVEPDRVEFTVVDTRVVGCQTGSGLAIPQNGLVLSFAPGALPAGAIPNEGLPRVRYGWARKEFGNVQQAIQAGPLLVQGGQVVVASESLTAEEFWPTPVDRTGPDDMGLVPTDYPEDVDRTRAGRIGLGVDGEGRLIVVAVPSAERGTHRPEADSAGATLRELAEFLAQAGALNAINLDGGGSTQLFYLGGLTTVPGNRYQRPGVQFERMVPSIGVWH